MGPFLHVGSDLEAFALYSHRTFSACVHLHFEVVQADVRGDRYLDRQCKAPEGKIVGKMDCKTVPEAVPNGPDARTAIANVDSGVFWPVSEARADHGFPFSIERPRIKICHERKTDTDIGFGPEIHGALQCCP